MAFVTWPRCCRTVLLAACLGGWAAGASARDEGGLYIAGEGFSFQAAAERALAQNRGGQRFFLLTLPDQAAALRIQASPAQARLRQRVLAGNGVLLVCQRDLDNRRLNPATLVPEIVPVRGWPAAGAPQPPASQRLFAGEDPATLPASDAALRRLRATCS
ncbi:MAG: hypothetical protein J0M00_25725 [Burkholderiales bacterium]|nr:hypothetical protein [Burkholderiales bacterium]